MANRVEYLKLVFNDINFTVTSNISNEINEMFKGDLVPNLSYNLQQPPNTADILRALENTLRKAKKELNQARKRYRHGTIGVEEVQDHEFYISEIRAEIENIRSGI